MNVFGIFFHPNNCVQVMCFEIPLKEVLRFSTNEFLSTLVPFAFLYNFLGLPVQYSITMQYPKVSQSTYFTNSTIFCFERTQLRSFEIK